MIGIENIGIEIILKYGFPAIGALLMVLSYNLIKKSLNIREPNGYIISLIKWYLVFSSILIVSSFVLQIFESIQHPYVTVEVNPHDSKLWENNEKYYRWYNAQYALAKGDFLTNNIDKIKNKGIKYELLLFPGKGNLNSSDFKEKFERMREFIIEINKEIEVRDKVFVKLSRNQRIPSISFFSSEKEGEDATIYYIQSLIKDNGIPKVAFQTSHKTVVEYFDDTFQKEWKDAKYLDIDSLLNENIKNSDFFL